MLFIKCTLLLYYKPISPGILNGYSSKSCFLPLTERVRPAKPNYYLVNMSRSQT